MLVGFWSSWWIDLARVNDAFGFDVRTA